MKRRTFIKSAAATAAMPLLPSTVASPVAPGLYAQAAKAARVWAYTSIGNLKHLLGVDAHVAGSVLAKLQADGIIAAPGPNGLALSKAFKAERTAVAAKMAAKAVAPRAQPVSRQALRRLCDDALQVQDRRDPAPSEEAQQEQEPASHPRAT